MSNELPRVEGMSLDNPHVDKAINAGTTASNCQPRHTRDELNVNDNSSSASDDDDDDGSSTSNTSPTTRKERKAIKKEQKAAAQAKKKRETQDAQDPKKMGYVQMAKMGYQELVNAIIRPPRAEYKVSGDTYSARRSKGQDLCMQ